jgi:hypothetical protein
MVGLAILKQMHDLSDEVLCERWIENPYYQLFCGEEFFQHALVFDRSSMTRWRQRMGEEKLVALNIRQISPLRAIDSQPSPPSETGAIAPEYRLCPTIPTALGASQRGWPPTRASRASFRAPRTHANVIMKFLGLSPDGQMA